MSRFHDQTSMWFNRGEDPAELAETPEADSIPSRRRRAPYFALGLASASLAAAVALYVGVKLNAGSPPPPLTIAVEQPPAAPSPSIAPSTLATPESDSDPVPVPSPASASTPVPAPAAASAIALPDPAPPPTARKLKKPRKIRQPSPAVRAADLLLQKRQTAAALAAYQQILSQSPSDTLALRGACLALDRLGRVNDAARVCRHALGIDPDDSTTRAVLARIYYKGGAYQWSANEWRLLLAQNPRDLTARRGLKLAKARL
jgi:tetratricopeptide (TPR) repeat protein